MLAFFFEEIEAFLLEEEKVQRWVIGCIENENRTVGDLSFIFCNDSYLLTINQEFLNHDFYTDVITFDYSTSDIIAGDIFISTERIMENAKQFKVSFDYELLRVIIHGVLHLLGYKDKTKKDKLIMTSKEDEYLNIFENA